MDFDFTSGNLDDALGSDFDTEETTPETTLDPAPEVTPDAQGDVDAPSPQADAAPEQRATPEPEAPDVPGGNAAGAFKAYRNEIATLKAQLAEFQAQQEQARQQAEMAAFNAQVEELAGYDPEAAAQLVQQKQAEIARTYQEQAEARIASERANLSVEYARRLHPDFDTTIQRLQALGPAVNWAAFDQSADPAMAAYEFAKQTLPPDREALKAEILAELAPKLTPQKPKAPNLLGNLPAAAPNEGGLDMDQLTKRDYQKHGLDLLDHLPG